MEYLILGAVLLVVLIGAGVGLLVPRRRGRIDLPPVTPGQVAEEVSGGTDTLAPPEPDEAQVVEPAVVGAVVLVVLLVPPIVGTYQAATFETRRWAESDAGSALTSALEGDDDE